MKPTVRSSFPVTFLRFGAALILFLAAGAIVQNRLEARRNAGRYWFSAANMSPEGVLTYGVQRDNLFGQTEPLEFPENLQHPRRGVNIWTPPAGVLASVSSVNAGDVKWTSRQVSPLRDYYYYREHAVYEATTHWVWWNGPAGQFDRYDGVSRLREASLGPDGPAVKAPSRPASRFEMLKFEAGRYVVTPQGVYVLSPVLADLSAKLMFRGLCEAFGEATDQRPEVKQDYLKPMLLVVHGGALSLLDGGTGAPLREVKLPETALALINDHYPASVTLFDNGKVAVDGVPKQWNERTILLLGADGSVLRRADYNTQEIENRLNGGARSSRILFPTLFPPIPVLMETPALVQSILLSLVLAAIVLRHQTRIGRRGAKRGAWTIFAFVFGLFGAATYLVAYRDYRTEPCPGCGNRRPVAEDDCPHCRAPWPPPEPLGIELHTAG